MIYEFSFLTILIEHSLQYPTWVCTLGGGWSEIEINCFIVHIQEGVILCLLKSSKYIQDYTCVFVCSMSIIIYSIVIHIKRTQLYLIIFCL